jgi:hypothetical protein
MADRTKEQKLLLRYIQPGLVGLMDGSVSTLLIPNVQQALTVAYFVVGIELIVIAYVRYRFFATSFLLSCVEVILGGTLVFLSGVLIGSS